jgi:hypothetical protein
MAGNGGRARGETLRVTSNVPMISRRVHCLRPAAKAWVNGLLPSLAKKYGREVDQVTVGGTPPSNPGFFVSADSKGDSGEE